MRYAVVGDHYNDMLEIDRQVIQARVIRGVFYKAPGYVARNCVVPCRG